MIWQQSDENQPRVFGQQQDDEDDGSTEQWQPLQILMGQQRAAIFDLAWQHEGEMVASVSDIDNSLRVWQWRSKKLLAHVADHQHFVQGVAWSSDLLTTESSDRSCITYRVQNGKLKLVSR